ncbi:retrovirus-related pol polyprotein from transposon TNT 1-94 [Tanacetum coccineum]|uniref:Retrovirus-related pol polyprotein from transposon TNT 1-94 n=1 Tax=Tanacetum coccineum TaxID=301880 RepID=A0ABQ5BGE6_9ASTR
MYSIISLRKKNTLAEYMILSGADNRPPMLDKDLYDSWKSIMELYMQNREHRRMILESVENGPLIWPTVEENEIVENVVHTPSATTIAPGMFKLDLEPLPPRLLQNRDTHIDYLRNTQEQANILREIVKQAKEKQPLDSELDLAFKPMNNIKKVRFVEPLTSSKNIKQVESYNTSDSNTPVLSSTGVKCSTSNCGSKPPGNKKNDKISQPPSRNKKNKHSLSNANYKILCATCNKSMFDGVHDKCLLGLVQNGNKRIKSAKQHKKQNIWKPTGHVFTEVRFKWKPTSRTFTIVGNLCPLTRITSTNVVPPKKTTSHSDEIQKPEIKVYSRKPKNVKNIGSSKKAKIVESKNANHSEPNQLWGSTATDIPSSSSLVMIGCLDYTLVSGLRMFKTNDRESLSAHELSCALGKSKKSSHQPKAEDTNQEKLYLLHGPMSVASIKGKRYILVIVDDYSRFTWVRFLKTKNEAPVAIIKCNKNIQVHLNSTVRNVRTDNGTEYVNQTLREWYENIGITHQTSVARTPQQNGVVERQNWTLFEAARTMLIFSKALLFLWAKAINTAFYTQNRSLICLRYNKTPYELIQDKKPDLSFFYVFGSLFYPTNDNEDLGKFDAKADIGIFVGYAPAKKAFRIYNRRTRIIYETIHVTFDELTTMASE